jgi:hypothetical protein
LTLRPLVELVGEGEEVLDGMITVVDVDLDEHIASSSGVPTS